MLLFNLKIHSFTQRLLLFLVGLLILKGRLLVDWVKLNCVGHHRWCFVVLAGASSKLRLRFEWDRARASISVQGSFRSRFRRLPRTTASVPGELSLDHHFLEIFSLGSITVLTHLSVITTQFLLGDEKMITGLRRGHSSRHHRRHGLRAHVVLTLHKTVLPKQVIRSAQVGSHQG